MLSIAKNNVKALCYKAKALYHLGNYRESLVYAKSALSIQPNQVMIHIIQASDAKLSDSYTKDSFRKLSMESEFDKQPDCEVEIKQVLTKDIKVSTETKKGNLLIKLLKVLSLSCYEAIKKNKFAILIILIITSLAIKSKLLDLFNLII